MPDLKIIDRTELTNDELQDVLTQWQANFNIETGPLWQVGYIHGYQDGSTRLYFALHHLIVDAVSWRILIDDAKTLYEGGSLEKKASSYRQWVETVKTYATENNEELAYWQRQIQDQPDYTVLCSNKYEVVIRQVQLDSVRTKALLQKAPLAFTLKLMIFYSLHLQIVYTFALTLKIQLLP